MTRSETARWLTVRHCDEGEAVFGPYRGCMITVYIWMNNDPVLEHTLAYAHCDFAAEKTTFRSFEESDPSLQRTTPILHLPARHTYSFIFPSTRASLSRESARYSALGSYSSSNTGFPSASCTKSRLDLT